VFLNRPWKAALRQTLLLVTLFRAILGSDLGAADGSLLYTNDFSLAEVGKPPPDMLVLEGAFAVWEEGGAKFLELPGAPLESFAILFGPAESGNISVTARIFGTSHGRRHPVFGVGLGGASGYRLVVAPGKGRLELWRGDANLAGAPCAWSSGQWVRLRLQVRTLGEQRWVFEGRFWPDGTPEPTEWQVRWEETQAPKPSRALLCGSPFAGTAIRFDDVALTRLP
jgi:hypothetical protein